MPDAPVMDFVFTVCDSAAGEACPVWPGQLASLGKLALQDKLREIAHQDGASTGGKVSS